nr:MAG TPA: hypothetical protein [Caudoviricetes sp.]
MIPTHTRKIGHRGYVLFHTSATTHFSLIANFLF